MSSREPFDELEAELLALGDLLDVPTPPPSDVAAAVRARLESTPDAAPAPGGEGADAGEPLDPGGGPDPAHGPPATPIRPHSHRPRRRPPGRRRRWKVVTAVVIVVIAITAATPQGRAAVARILRFAGIELEIGAAPPPPVTTTAPLPGERTVPPSEVPSRAGFQVRTPSRLGPPQRTSVADGGRLVSIFWPDGIRLDQFEGTMDPYFFKKAGPPFPDFVKVGPYQALWLPGEHPLGYIKRVDGSVVPLRQAAATLIWQQNGITYRLEGVRTKEEAIRIAESLE